MGNREFIQLQIEALVIRYYIVLYDELEKEIKRLFSEKIAQIDATKKELLYFYLAGIKSNNVHIEYGSKALVVTNSRFSSEENFSMLTLSQIIKIQREEHLLDVFDFNIQSINSKTTEYLFTDCCIKLLNMRNKLAHEISSLKFMDQDIIEILSNEYIENNGSEWFSSLDTKLMTDESKSIFSNLIIMKKILSAVRKRVETK